jgi:hypothetical protein
MAISQEQQGSFDRVVAELEGLGYEGELLSRRYAFGDWFSEGTPERKVDAAAFARTPIGPESACFVVAMSNGEHGIDLIRNCRALGAPRALEIDAIGQIYHWRVGTDPTDSDMQSIIPPKDIGSVFRENREKWSPRNILRIKNLGPVDDERQLDFIDLGLMPAIEQNVRDKIDPLLRDTLHAAKVEIERQGIENLDPLGLYQLVFRALTGKILHDRGVNGFTNGNNIPDPDNFLARVAKHYREPEQYSVFGKRARRVVLEKLWAGVNLKHISVETLAYVWENLLLTAQDRRALSIHATPPSIARYIVNRLPIDEKTGERGPIVEPCCGASTFLIAAMQRLRDELPRSMSGSERHHYFKGLLYGFDIEGFGLEVARSSLMLADFPYPNKWNLDKADVFGPTDKWPDFDAALRRASVVLCNPPFRPFSEDERREYGTSSFLPPVELLARVLDRLQPHGMIGFVMPLQLLTGKSYALIRERIARRFSDFEVVSLPDKVFDTAEHETVLLIAHGQRRASNPACVFHRKVDDGAWPTFRDYHVASSEAKGTIAPEEATINLGIVELQNVWTNLAKLPRLRDVADEIHRGIEWNISVKKNRRLLISDKAKPGFRKGIPSAPKGAFVAYHCPPVKYLNVEPQYQLYKAFDLPWELPKVVMSASRKSRSPWRIAAFGDTDKLVCYHAFTCLWPTAGWSISTIAAIINSPVANAYVASHEGDRNNTIESISEIPVPLLSHKTIRFIDSRVTEYSNAVDSGSLFGEQQFANSGEVLGFVAHPRSKAEILREIDAAVVKAYGLPKSLEIELLSYFQNAASERPVSVTQSIYSPQELDQIYAKIEHKLEPPGVGPSESWDYLQRKLDEDRLSSRKLFP